MYEYCYVFRRGLDQFDRVWGYLRYQGESSHYTVPGRVPMCDQKVLLLWDVCAICWYADMYVLCMLCMIRTGRSRWYGPEGQEVTDRKVNTGRTGRSTGIWDGSPLRHSDRRVPQSYGLERCMCCMWYFGELTKHLCLQCCVMCFRYQWGSREGVGMTRTHTHWSWYVLILGFCIEIMMIQCV